MQKTTRLVSRKINPRFAKNLFKFYQYQSPFVRNQIFKQYPTGVILSKAPHLVSGFQQHGLAWRTQIGTSDIKLELNYDNQELKIFHCNLDNGDHFSTTIYPQTILNQTNGTVDLETLFTQLKSKLTGTTSPVSVYDRVDMSYINTVYGNNPYVQWTVPIINNYVNIKFPIELKQVNDMREYHLLNQNSQLKKELILRNNILKNYERQCVVGQTQDVTCTGLGNIVQSYHPYSYGQFGLSNLGTIGSRGVVSSPMNLWLNRMYGTRRFSRLNNLKWYSGRNVMKNGLECTLQNGTIVGTNFIPTQRNFGNIYFEIDIHKKTSREVSVVSINDINDNFKCLWYSDGSLCIGGRRTELRREKLGNDLIQSVSPSESYKESAVFKHSSSLPGKIKLPINYDLESIYKRKEKPIVGFKQGDRLGFEFDLLKRTVSLFKNGKLVMKDAVRRLPKRNVQVYLSAPWNGVVNAVLNPTARHPVIQLLNRLQPFPRHTKMM